MKIQSWHLTVLACLTTVVSAPKSYAGKMCEWVLVSDYNRIEGVKKIADDNGRYQAFRELVESDMPLTPAEALSLDWMLQSEVNGDIHRLATNMPKSMMRSNFMTVTGYSIRNQWLRRLASIEYFLKHPPSTIDREYLGLIEKLDQHEGIQKAIRKVLERSPESYRTDIVAVGTKSKLNPPVVQVVEDLKRRNDYTQSQLDGFFHSYEKAEKSPDDETNAYVQNFLSVGEVAAKRIEGQPSTLFVLSPDRSNKLGRLSQAIEKKFPGTLVQFNPHLAITGATGAFDVGFRSLTLPLDALVDVDHLPNELDGMVAALKIAYEMPEGADSVFSGKVLTREQQLPLAKALERKVRELRPINLATLLVDQYETKRIWLDLTLATAGSNTADFDSSVAFSLLRSFIAERVLKIEKVRGAFTDIAMSNAEKGVNEFVTDPSKNLQFNREKMPDSIKNQALPVYTAVLYKDGNVLLEIPLLGMYSDTDEARFTILAKKITAVVSELTVLKQQYLDYAAILNQAEMQTNPLERHKLLKSAKFIKDVMWLGDL